MGLFDRYLIVDWSGANVPVKGRDSIWACLMARDADGRDGGAARIEWLENFATRHVFMERLATVVAETRATGRRLLAGFDFAFGYPQGTAQRLTGGQDWRALWRKLALEISDGPDNANNRFEVASNWNRDYFADGARFWGRPRHLDLPHLGDKKPAPTDRAPFAFRQAEAFAKGAKSVWQLAYPGSVGSQSLLGIARLSRFLDESGHGDAVSVWPFETGFSASFAKPIVFAEIYPSLFSLDLKLEPVKDAVQVRTVAEAFAHFDAAGRFATLFERPIGLAEEAIGAVLKEEGWVLGIGHDALSTAATVTVPAPPQESMASVSDYIRDPAEIYRQSFATIRKEADLSRFSNGMEALAIRLIHACGMIDVADDIAFSDGAFEAGAAALLRGAPVLCDAEMVRHGIIRRLLPADNPVLCLLNDERVRPRALEIGNTRSAAQVDLWDDHLGGAVVAIGNAPTALFRLLERVDAGAPRPALILGFPVGFVGAAESKEALIADSRGIPYIAVRGRRGGSAMASAAVNAIAGGLGAND